MRSTSRKMAALVGLSALLLPLLAGCGGGNLCCPEGDNGSVNVIVRSAANSDSAPRATDKTGEQR